MATRIPQRELRNDNAKVMRRVAAGETFVITRDGVPVADLTPHLQSDGPAMFVPAATLTAFGDQGALDVPAWLTDIRAADEFLDDDPGDRSGG